MTTTPEGLHDLQTEQLVTIAAVLTIINGWDIEDALGEIQEIIKTRYAAENY